MYRKLPGSPLFPQMMHPTHIESLEFSILIPTLPKKQQQLLVNGKQAHNPAGTQTVPDFCKHSTTAGFKY